MSTARKIDVQIDADIVLAPNFPELARQSLSNSSFSDELEELLVGAKPGGDSSSSEELEELLVDAKPGGDSYSSEELEEPLADAKSGGQLGLSVSPRKLGKTKKIPNHVVKKIARNRGKEYFTDKGKFKPQKLFKFQPCQCKYKCRYVQEEDRQKLFSKFWKSGCWQTQNNFISSTIKISDPRRCRVENSRKKVTRAYFLNGNRVCKEVYLNTLGISNNRVNYTLKKVENGICPPDKRGKTHHNKAPNKNLDNIKIFLSKIPKYRSHYSNSSRQYLSPDLNKKNLYDMYTLHEFEAHRIPARLPVFNKILFSYDIAFYCPKTDTCQSCDALEIKIRAASNTEKTALKQTRDAHQESAQSARKKMNECSILSVKDNSNLTFTFDIQKVHLLPHLQTSVVYYKRQLSLFNLGIHNCNTNQGHMAMWTENEGNRGANEVCSGIEAFLQSTDLRGVKKIYSFSDSCGLQNNNETIINYFMWVCDTKNINEWEHTYLESGHSYLPNDKDFSVIEKSIKQKKCSVYDKAGWFQIVESSKLKQPFKTIDMANRFIQFDHLTKLRTYNSSKTSDYVNFSFLNVKVFRITKNSNILEYKTQHKSDQWFKFNYPLLKTDYPEIEKCDYENLTISKETFTDLISLLQYIPPAHQQFYKNLQH